MLDFHVLVQEAFMNWHGSTYFSLPGKSCWSKNVKESTFKINVKNTVFWKISAVQDCTWVILCHIPHFIACLSGSNIHLYCDSERWGEDEERLQPREMSLVSVKELWYKMVQDPFPRLLLEDLPLKSLMTIVPRSPSPFSSHMTHLAQKCIRSLRPGSPPFVHESHHFVMIMPIPLVISYPPVITGSWNPAFFFTPEVCQRPSYIPIYTHTHTYIRVYKDTCESVQIIQMYVYTELHFFITIRTTFISVCIKMFNTR